MKVDEVVEVEISKCGKGFGGGAGEGMGLV